jgi:Uma2 family endonuclease
MAMVTMMTYDPAKQWTEEEYFALGETSERIELFDGSLLVSPSPTFRHQHIARRLANVLDEALVESGPDLEVFEAINVRLRRGRISIPDVVVVQRSDDQLVAEAAEVELICEITSLGHASRDRVFKFRRYAEAGIPWYLLIEPDPILLRLFRLVGGAYDEHSVAKSGEVLSLTEPVRVDIDADALTRR